MFSKPIYNMRGMGAGSRVLALGATDYEPRSRPGHMWMEICDGEHVATDVAVIDGERGWWRHTVGKSLGEGLFDYWTVLAEPRADLERSLGRLDARRTSADTRAR